MKYSVSPENPVCVKLGYFSMSESHRKSPKTTGPMEAKDSVNPTTCFIFYLAVAVDRVSSSRLFINEAKTAFTSSTIFTGNKSLKSECCGLETWELK